jgi:hypothetical protein
MTTKTKRAYNRRPTIPQVEIPPAHNHLDRLVDTLVDAWNNQRKDAAADEFFAPSLFGERHALIDAATRRYPEGTDRDFVRAWLKELARAIYGAAYRWM